MAKKLSLAKNAMYNTVGVLIYCICQWATTMVVVRMFDTYDSAGIFQLAISVTNIFYAISTYNMRTYQISDTKGEYSDNEYIGTRIVTSIISLLLCTVYAIFNGYSAKVVLCICAYMIFKLSEAIVDVLHGIDQKNYRMDYVGISYIIRGIVMLASFVLAIKFTGDILSSMLIMAASCFAVVLLFDIPKTKKFNSLVPSFNIKKIGKMLLVCLPAVLASSAFAAVVTVPRQMLERLYGESILGYYATVATPVVVIQVLATSIFNPMLTALAEDYNEGRKSKFIATICKTQLFIAAIAVASLIGAYFLGKFALTLLYGSSIDPYTYLLYGCILCAVLYTVCWMISSVLIIIRKLNYCMIISIAALLISAVCSKPMIEKFYMNGVSFDIILCYIIFAILGMGIIIFNLKKRK